MIIYAESSAVLAWLLGEPAEARIRPVLDDADRIMTSALTGVECARALGRARATRRISAVEELAALQLLDRAEAGWDVVALGDDVLRRARAPFPADPVRTLDALHVATALFLRDAIGPVAILSLDDRLRACVVALGFEALPA